MRPSTQVVTLRFRRASSTDGSDALPSWHGALEGGTVVEGTLDWPEEQASAVFQGRIFGKVSVSPSAVAASDSDAGAVAVLALEGRVGEVLQGAPERVGWVSGAEIRGTFCKDGTDGTVKGSWSARAPATTLEPLRPGGMRLNVGLLPDRLFAAEGTGPGGGRSAPGEGGSGSGGDAVMSSSCRWGRWGFPVMCFAVVGVVYASHRGSLYINTAACRVNVTSLQGRFRGVLGLACRAVV